MRTNHDWQMFDRYLDIHQSNLDQVETYFVVQHTLREPVLETAHEVQFRGVVRCHGSIDIFANIWLDRDVRNRVRPSTTGYHAQTSMPQVINILRYDNAPHDPTHPDPFHKHLFDASGKQTGVERVGRDAFPTLRNVIDEVFEWWKAHRDDPLYDPTLYDPNR